MIPYTNPRRVRLESWGCVRPLGPRATTRSQCHSGAVMGGVRASYASDADNSLWSVSGVAGLGADSEEDAGVFFVHIAVNVSMADGPY